MTARKIPTGRQPSARGQAAARLAADLLELLAPLGPVAARRMFGGVGLFHGATMFALVAGEEAYFKVGDANRAEYEAAGEGPFSYDTRHGRHVLTSYWRCPPELLDEPETLRDWAGRAIAVAAGAARAKPQPRPPARP